MTQLTTTDAFNRPCGTRRSDSADPVFETLGLAFGYFSLFQNSASPAGRFENSPLFQEWVCKDGAPSPEGTVELLPQDMICDAANAQRRHFVFRRDASHESPKPVAKFRCAVGHWC